MKPFPKVDNSLLVRTDFGDDAAWNALCAAVTKPVGEFGADVTPVNDRAYEAADPKQLVPLAQKAELSFLLVADAAALGDPEQAVLVVDAEDEPGRSFRVIPSEAWSVENNLSLANMDFEEFADAVDARGVFRGFDD